MGTGPYQIWELVFSLLMALVRYSEFYLVSLYDDYCMKVTVNVHYREIQKM